MESGVVSISLGPEPLVSFCDKEKKFITKSKYSNLSIDYEKKFDVLIEASGGLTLGNARDVAETGVHFISVGGLTHSSPILDIGLDFETIV
jgi:nicotinate-nucleotide pyrophosphorylase